VGNVVTPWTRKAPGFRKETGTATSKAEPRRGVAILFLKGLEQDGGGSADFLVFQGSGIERQGTAQHRLRKGALLFHGEMFESVQQCFGVSAHEHIIPAHRRAKKREIQAFPISSDLE
jgi:hypothetical protein